jgi:hypothetical protein
LKRWFQQPQPQRETIHFHDETVARKSINPRALAVSAGRELQSTIEEMNHSLFVKGEHHHHHREDSNEDNNINHNQHHERRMPSRREWPRFSSNKNPVWNCFHNDLARQQQDTTHSTGMAARHCHRRENTEAMITRTWMTKEQKPLWIRLCQKFLSKFGDSSRQKDPHLG